MSSHKVRNTINRLLAAFAVAAAITLGGAHNAVAAESSTANMITAPFGTGSYVLGNALEQISKKTSAPVRVSASETPGLVYNAKKLANDPELKKDTMMVFTTGIDYLAVNGLKPFTKKYPETKLIANSILVSVWLATLDPQITTANDLIDKRIGLGRPPQIAWTIEPETIIEHGWEMHDKIDIQRLGTKQAAQALLDGSVDAAIIGGYVDPIKGAFSPSPQTVTLLGSGRDLGHVSWGASAIDKTIARGMKIKPFDVPAQAVSGLDTALEGFFDAVAWVAYPEFDDHLAYEVTKMIIDNVKQFGDYHALGKLMSKQSLVYGWDAKDIHPGALRAYREANLIK